MKRSVSWNKYRSETTTRPNNNNLNYMIDSTFRNINRLFVLSFKYWDNDPSRNSFDKYYIPRVEIKDLNLIQDGPFWGCSLLGGKKPSPQNLSRLSYNDETWQSYTLPKENPKNLWITWHTFCVLLTSAFLYQKLGNLALSRNTDIDCILVVSNSFHFFWVFKDWSSKHGYNFDDASKNGYSRPS